MTETSVPADLAAAACPACGESVAVDAKFCEACGADLTTTHASPGAGAPGAGGADAGAPAVDGADPGAPVVDGAGAPAAAAPETVTPGEAPGQAAAAGAAARLIADREGEGYPAACPSCGSTIADDGYCERCGERAPLWRDHFEDVPGEGLAMVCDRGIRHRRNEDAGLIAVHPHGGAVLVVCDGVSSSADSDVASLAAVRAAGATLLAQIPPPTTSQKVLPPPPEGGSDGAPTEPLPVAATPTLPDTPLPPPDEDGRTPTSGGVTRAGVIGEVMVRAVQAANDAVVESARPESSGNPPSCTYVAGVLETTPHGSLLVVSWIGDSRAYWVPDESTGHRPERLSTDDSWAAEEIALGVPREEAESGPHAHAITRWLGPDAPDLRPHRAARLVEGPGWVVLCSDGLWNYCSEPTALAATMRSVVGSGEGDGGPSADPLTLAQGLVSWANAQGGQDNITVALARVQG